MKAKKIHDTFILVALFLLPFLETGFASNNEETSVFNRGNVYYEQANYDEAIKQYNSILESGWESGNLYYNLGNCYFKKGQLGRAILNYEKARRLIPLDKDLESNYEYARSLIKDGIFVSKKSFPVRVLNNLFEKFTIDGLTILLSTLYVLILITILISLFFQAFKKHVLVIVAFMVLFFIAGFIGLKRKITLLNKEGVVIVEQVDAKFEPMDKATTHFTLYEGMKVEVSSSKNNWYKIKRQDNKSGWIENSALNVF
ncbi:MAG: tetratricopeptide repeat protein [Candidatus Omnitrophica bacterium]|nr:tetratricopeptide repeat protein [Candidatus Omnitrophota bacterium]